MISIPPTSNLFHKTLHFEPHIFKFKGALLPRHAACFHKKSTMIEYHKKGGGGARPLGHIQEMILLVS